MQPAMLAAAIVLALVALGNWGYAAWRTFNGTPFQDSLALMIVGLACLTMIAILGVVTGKKKG
ncbi:MAG: hypothetical protein ACXIVL_05690 [Oceanicaulis sp.]